MAVSAGLHGTSNIHNIKFSYPQAMGYILGFVSGTNYYEKLFEQFLMQYSFTKIKNYSYNSNVHCW